MRNVIDNPHKHLGQNFLHNEGILHKIIQAANLTTADRVLEIGPGTGNLTRNILQQNIQQMHALEKDMRFIEDLENLKQQYPDIFTYSIGDATTVDFSQFCVYNKIIANLAYNIAGHLLKTWIQTPDTFDLYVITIQREMAERIMAKPNNKTYGKLSILMQIQFEVKTVLNIKRTSFFPVPKVDGTTILFKPKNQTLSDTRLRQLASLLDLIFANRRKQMHNLLSQAYDISKNPDLDNFDLQKRPENFSPTELLSLTEIIHTKAKS